MRTLSVTAHVHTAIGALTGAVGVGLAVAMAAGVEVLPDTLAWISVTTGGATVLWLLVIAAGWALRRPPFGGPGPFESTRTALLLALFAGLGSGAHAGLLHEATFSGPDHPAAMTVYFGLLPTGLVVCVPRRPLRRAFAGMASLMAGVEVSAQLTMSWSKWGELKWWGDITTMDVGYLLGGMAVAVLWRWLQRFFAPGRRPATPEAPDADPPGRG